MLSPAAVRKRLRTALHIPDDCAAVWGDPGRLEQILYNLAGNAIKYTDSGSVTIRAEREQSFVRISVEDMSSAIR